MKTQFLHKVPGNVWLIVIFDGWSARREWLEGKQWPSGFDVLRCSDYTDFDFDKELLKGYRAVHLYAWSLGVFAASVAMDGVKLASAYAISGTETPVSDTSGIPHAIFRGTREGLNERNLRKFRRRMFNSAADFASIESISSEEPDDIDSLKAQLLAVEERASHHLRSSIDWTLAIIGRQDAIFPPEAQRMAWSGRTQIVETADAHFADIQNLVGHTLVDADNVGRQFGRSLETYESNATPQKTIAEHLTEILKSADASRGGRMLEIGPGTGILTRLIVPVLKPDTGVFVDVCKLPESGLLANEERYQEDASRWILAQDDCMFDQIVSSSAIQWVNGLNDFLVECHRVMKEGGILCVSTFGPGTLAELETLGHGGLHYYSADEIRQMLAPVFSRVYIEEDVLSVRFDTSREALMHIKRTGVTAAGRLGSQRQGAGIASMLSPGADGRYTLTYHPIYILAHK